MNILQILPALNIGGVERGVVDLAKYLTRHGHKSIVVSSGGVMVSDLLKQSKSIHYQLPVHRKNPFSMFLMVRRLKEIIKKDDIDIVHARSRVPAWIAFFACRKTKAIFITTCHGYYSSKIFSYVMGWGRLCIVISQAIAKRMVEGFGVPFSNIRMIFRGVDLDSFRFRGLNKTVESKFLVGMIARITPLKGHAHFLKAIAKAKISIPNIKVWIVGEAPKDKAYYQEEIKTLVKRLGLEETVEFLGRHSDIPKVLKKLDLLVTATVTPEAFGRSILEAQAVGVPVVATRVGGIVEIVDNQRTGILVPPLDIDAMAEAIIKIQQNRDLTQNMVMNARKKVEATFSLEKMCKATLEVYKEIISSKRILVIKWSAVGDVVLSIPAFRALRKNFPKAKIYCLTSSAVSSILVRCPYIDGLIIFDSKGKDRGFWGMFGVVKELISLGFDIVIDLQNNNRSHILGFCSRAPKRYGYKNKKLGLLLNRGIELPDATISPVSHQFRILEKLNIKDENLHLELWTSSEDEKKIGDLLNNQWVGAQEGIIGINISASPNWTTKLWPLENFAYIIDELSKKDTRVVITGTSRDKHQVVKLKRLTNTKFIDAVGKTTISELSYLIRRCKVYITGDSAPMHIAAAVDTPIITLFGPTDPVRHIPPTDKIIVIKKDLPCSPCYKRNCKTIDCMYDIHVKQVLEATESFLKNENSTINNPS